MDRMKRHRRPPDMRLLEHLLMVSGLPLADLQFLAANGMLNTCLRQLAGGDYTPEAWDVALTALCGRPVRPEHAGEMEQRLTALEPRVPAAKPDNSIQRGYPL